MATVLCCGFECGLAHWTQTQGTTNIVTSGQRSGARAAQFVRSASTQVFVSCATSFTGGVLVLRAWIYYDVIPDAPCGALGIDISGVHCGIKLFFQDSTPRFRTACNLGLGGFGGSPEIISGQWYALDLIVNTSANPWTVNAAVNGAPLLEASSATAADTTAMTPIVGLITGGNITATMIADDIQVSTTRGDFPLRDGGIYGFVPVSDGTHNIAGTDDFERGNTATDILNATTTAYQLVDDVPLPSGAVDEADCWRAVAPVNATDYVESVFGLIPGSPTPSGDPFFVEAICVHHQIATGAGSFDVFLNDNGTTGTIVSVSAQAGVTTYRAARAHFALAPTGGPWRNAIGPGNLFNTRVRFRCGDANPDQCLDAVMLEAGFDRNILSYAINPSQRRYAPFKPGVVTRVRN